MTPFLRLIRNTAEKLFGKYYEGPVTPDRFEVDIVLFAKFNPKATRAEWMHMAAQVARQAYEAGWTRGYEWAERDLDQFPTESPEVEEHHLRHTLTWDGFQLLKDFDEFDEIVTDDDGEDDTEKLREYEREQRERTRTRDYGHRYSR